VVGRSILLIDCISGLKEVRVRTVGFVRSGSVRSIFDVFDIRCLIVRLVNKGIYEYKSGTRKKLETLAKVEEVATS